MLRPLRFIAYFPHRHFCAGKAGMNRYPRFLTVRQIMRGGKPMSELIKVDLELLESVQRLLSYIRQDCFEDPTSPLANETFGARTTASFGPAASAVQAIPAITDAHATAQRHVLTMLITLYETVAELEYSLGSTVAGYSAAEAAILELIARFANQDG